MAAASVKGLSLSASVFFAKQEVDLLALDASQNNANLAHDSEEVSSIHTHWVMLSIHPKKDALKDIFQKYLAGLIESAYQTVQEILANSSIAPKQAQARLGNQISHQKCQSVEVQKQLTTVLTDPAELKNEMAYVRVQALVFEMPVFRFAANHLFEKLAAREKTQAVATQFRALVVDLKPHQKAAMNYLQATMPDLFAKFANDVGPAQQLAKTAASQSDAKDSSK